MLDTYSQKDLALLLSHALTPWKSHLQGQSLNLKRLIPVLSKVRVTKENLRVDTRIFFRTAKEYSFLVCTVHGRIVYIPNEVFHQQLQHVVVGTWKLPHERSYMHHTLRLTRRLCNNKAIINFLHITGNKTSNAMRLVMARRNSLAASRKAVWSRYVMRGSGKFRK